MRKALTICSLFAAFSMLAMAENWSGKLLDAACYDKNKTNDESCAAKKASEAYLLDVNGTIYHLTVGSNDMIRRAMESFASRSENPNAPAKGATINANVTGTLTEKDHIKVEKIELQ